MQIAVDIGNTRVKAGVFSGEQLLKSVRFNDWNDKEWTELWDKYHIESLIISSVESEEFTNTLTIPYEVNRIDFYNTTPIPIINKYLKPESLGKDRLAGAVGGWKHFKEKAVLIIDSGTCIKYDFINEQKEYLGGNISPGMQMRLEAMHHYTARLPLFYLEEVNDFIGRDTKSSMMTGVDYGVKGEIMYFIDLYEKRFGKICVILTGGNAEFLSLQLDKKYPVDNDLVLKGLNTILNFNNNYEF